MRFWDCVDSNLFDNYWYLDGISDKLGYNRFKQIQIQGSVIEIEKSDLPLSDSLYTMISTVAKLIGMLTVILPAIMIAGKAVYHLNHVFILAEKPLAINERITVGTYNILFPQELVAGAPAKFSSFVGYNQDEEGTLFENSQMRVGIIAENILKADLDVICLQETTDAMCQHLQTSLTDHFDIKWVKHNNFEGVGILYKKDKFELLHEEVVSLHVEIKEDVNSDASRPSPSRVHLLYDLMDKTTRIVFRVVSCHLFDPNTLQNKEEHASKVIDSAETEPQGYLINRTIIAGDMNQDQFGDASSIPQYSPSEQLAASFQPFIINEYRVNRNFDSTEYKKLQPGNGKLHSTNRHVDWVWVKQCRPEHYPLSDFDNRGSNHTLTASLIC